MNVNQVVEQLAADIGDRIYIDVAKWHLYLKDAKLHSGLAESFLPMCESGKIDEATVKTTLAAVKVKLGGGKQELSLAELIPTAVIGDLVRILEDCARSL
jgi:Protein of unknown function (DUF3181)